MLINRDDGMDKRAIQPQETAALITASAHISMLKRKCTCGQHTIVGGQYADCRKKWLPWQHRATTQAEPATVPPIVHGVLQAAVEAESGRLMANEAVASVLMAGGAVPRVLGGSIHLVQSGDPGHLGKRIARAVHGGIGE